MNIIERYKIMIAYEVYRYEYSKLDQLIYVVN